MSSESAEPGQGAQAGGVRAWSGGGREELAQAVRTLMAATVDAVAPPGVLDDATARIAALVKELEAYVPDVGPIPRNWTPDGTIDRRDPAILANRLPFDMVVGTCNPLAPPITMEAVPPKAVGHTVFTAPFEGAPGCVHGAALAAAFDLVLTAANLVADAAGPTVTLSISYLKPTKIGVPCLFESWVTNTEGRRTYSHGQLVQDGVVTVEAEGEFRKMDPDRIASMHRR
jgi:acyl-coenzyme A thioesterase PaaI-like protein